MDEPTPHQAEKLKLVSQDEDFHIRAAAGAGKTFVALNHLVKMLETKRRCLYVARNPALCFSVVKWLEKRLRSSRLLKNLMLLFEPLEQPRTIKIAKGRVETELAADRDRLAARRVALVARARACVGSRVDGVSRTSIEGPARRTPRACRRPRRRRGTSTCCVSSFSGGILSTSAGRRAPRASRTSRPKRRTRRRTRRPLLRQCGGAASSPFLVLLLRCLSALSVCDCCGV